MTAEPLTPEELAQARSWAARGLLEGLTHDEVARLVATVDAPTAQRDAARSCIRRMKAGFTPWPQPEIMEWAGFRGSEPMSDAEAAEIQAATQELG